MIKSRLLDATATVKGTALLDLAYVCDARGLITSIASPDPNQAWTYQYDALDRLSYAYNPVAGNRRFGYDDADNPGITVMWWTAPARGI
jgi:YD repeat-containing protein